MRAHSFCSIPENSYPRLSAKMAEMGDVCSSSMIVLVNTRYLTHAAPILAWLLARGGRGKERREKG